MTIRELHKLLAESGANKTDRVLMLITACIESGHRKGPDIVKEITALGFNRAHVGATLAYNCGANPDAYRWWRDEAGDYQLH